MADETDPEQEDATPSPRPEPSRRKALTPEQRRLLGTARSLPHRQRDEPAEPPSSREPAAPALERPAARPSGASPIEPTDPTAAAPAEERRRGPSLQDQTKASRHVEMRHAILVIGVLIFLVAIFYAGRKFDRAKGFIMSRMNAKALDAGPEKFPGLTSEELVEAALAAEKQGDWEGAAQRFLEAKRKDLRYQGILFHIGKTAYDRRDWVAAEKALDQSVKFGENIAVANQLRGLIAVRQKDLAAAGRFFEAASKAEPFMADFYYLWGDTLRLDQRPREAIRRYHQAIQRSRTAQDATLCRFKIRLARIEAAEASALSVEVEEARKAGPLSIDWLMTDAALQMHAGKIKEAAELISQAKAGGLSPMFIGCAGDTVFLKAAEAHPEIAAVGLAAPAK